MVTETEAQRVEPSAAPAVPGRRHDDATADCRLSGSLDLLRMRLASGVSALLLYVALLLSPTAGAAATDSVTGPGFDGSKELVILFLMLGPVRILLPYVAIARSLDAVDRMRLATRSVMFCVAALAAAGLLGRAMMKNLAVSLPALALTGGVILFVVALQAVLKQFTAAELPAQGTDPVPGMRQAFSPLAFPTIVPPQGIAAVIVFATLAGGDRTEEMTLAGIVLGLLLLDWVAMLFAEPLLKWAGTVLQVIAVVVGVAQAALGMQIIIQSLGLIGLIHDTSG